MYLIYSWKVEEQENLIEFIADFQENASVSVKCLYLAMPYKRDNNTSQGSNPVFWTISHKLVIRSDSVM